MSEPEFIITGKPIDFELCELLGESYGDFIILCLNGEPLQGFGTPYDKPNNRRELIALVDAVNDRSRKSLWPKMFESWARNIRSQFNLAADVTAKDFRPIASIKINRVCHGYSEHLHCAIRLFEQLEQHIRLWSVTKDANDKCIVEIQPVAALYVIESGELPSLVIATAVKRMLLDMKSRNLNP